MRKKAMSATAREARMGVLVVMGAAQQTVWWDCLETLAVGGEENQLSTVGAPGRCRKNMRCVRRRRVGSRMCWGIEEAEAWATWDMRIISGRRVMEWDQRRVIRRTVGGRNEIAIVRRCSETG
jgi:hypothetical protein